MNTCKVFSLYFLKFSFRYSKTIRYKDNTCDSTKNTILFLTFLAVTIGLYVNFRIWCEIANCFISIKDSISSTTISYFLYNNSIILKQLTSPNTLNSWLICSHHSNSWNIAFFSIRLFWDYFWLWFILSSWIISCNNFSSSLSNE